MAPPITPLKLLYVEDNRINALLFGEAMSVLPDVELRVAEDGDEAIDMLRDASWRPDVLVLDAQLPGTSGFELLPLLRALPGLSEVPAFMCSADAQPEHVERARLAGFSGYWPKPIDLRRVVSDLRQIGAADHR